MGGDPLADCYAFVGAGAGGVGVAVELGESASGTFWADYPGGAVVFCVLQPAYFGADAYGGWGSADLVGLLVDSWAVFADWFWLVVGMASSVAAEGGLVC